MQKDPAPETDPFFELTAFLVSSARGALEEGVFTASLRLLDAAARLASLTPAFVNDAFLADFGPRAAELGPAAYLDSPERYIAFLDEILVEVASESARRTGAAPDRR
jgi:Family of unknown function (DUF6092)